MDALVEKILELPPAVALLVVFAVPALEASAFVGFIFPGEVACLLGGVLAFQGRVPLAAVVLAAIAGAVIGDSIGYLIGRRYGERLLLALPRAVVRPAHLDRTKEVINRLGGRAVFVGRFTAALRVLVPGMAGIAELPYRSFLVYNVAGGIVWAGGSVVLGYLAGASWRRVQHTLSTVGLGVAGAVVAVGLVVLLVRRRRAARRTAAELAAAAPRA